MDQRSGRPRRAFQTIQGRLLARYDADGTPLPTPKNKERTGSAHHWASATAPAARRISRPVRIRNLQFFARAPTHGEERWTKNRIPNLRPKTQLSTNHADIFNCLWGRHL